MLEPLRNKKIYVASEAIDFRLGLDGLADIVRTQTDVHIHDGSMFVFYNRYKNKIKILTWDTNGFVLYYKRLDNLRHHTITYEQLNKLLAGLNPIDSTRTKQLESLD